MLLPLLILETISQGVLGEAPSGTCYVLSNASHGECLAKSTCSTNGRCLQRTPRRLNYRRDISRRCKFRRIEIPIREIERGMFVANREIGEKLGTLDEEESKGMDHECVGVNRLEILVLEPKEYSNFDEGETTLGKASVRSSKRKLMQVLSYDSQNPDWFLRINGVDRNIVKAWNNNLEGLRKSLSFLMEEKRVVIGR
ncbi:hypothetical protein V1478_003858 [Vespula squamosa]|uniref:Uncharacterized protein n=1 Tax=Vespula squamosa TaxID=30214 RepID=A0ABD2BNC4_VESSQ